MRSGVNIDCRYVVKVKDLMTVNLPRPNKRLLDSDGTRLPLISVTCEG